MLPAFLALLALFVRAVPAGAAPAQQFGEFTVAVAAEPAGTQQAYQITVEHDGLPVSRLSAPYRGILSKTFVADLNHDGGFEVVVTMADDQGHATEVKVFSWQSELLQPLKLAQLEKEQQQGYRGEDEFAVADGKLIRVFQIY